MKIIRINFIVNSLSWFVVLNTKSLKLFCSQLNSNDLESLNKVNISKNKPWYRCINSYTKYNPITKQCIFYYDLAVDFKKAYFQKGKSFTYNFDYGPAR